MNKKKELTVVIIILFLFIGTFIFYIFNELLQENDIDNKPITINEAITFKKTYEALNDDTSFDYKKIEIPEINPMIAIDIQELISKMDNKETFIVFFCSPTSQWCRSMVVQMIETAKELDIDSIYYLSINDIKDVYELDGKKVVQTIEGTNEYHSLLEKLDNILENYPDLTYKNKKKKTISIKVKNKYIKEPSIIYVKDGVATSMCDGITDKQSSPVEVVEKEVTDEVKQEMLDLFNKYKLENEKKD